MRLIEYLDRNRHRDAEKLFFSFEDTDYTFEQAYQHIEARIKELRAEGYASKDSQWLVVDSPNTPSFVFTLLAALIMGVPAVLLNHRLTRMEKDERLSSLPAVDSLDGCVVLFTSGTTGRSKAVVLSEENLIGSALASNKQLNRIHEGLWQLVLPLYHVGGLQVVIRSLVNDSAFILYSHYDVGHLLTDAHRVNTTHISVVDKILRDMLTIDPRITAAYEVVLLGGGPLNEETIARCQAAHASIYASYGMTETSSQIASTLITDEFDGTLTLLEGYEAKILNPDEYGVGELAVRGPGVMQGYLEGDGSEFFEGYFLTGDRGVLRGNSIRVHERLNDLFISGGENIYPAQVERVLRTVLVVADAAVIGVPDATWGRVPVAFILAEAGRTIEIDTLYSACAQQLSCFAQPQEIFVLDKLPTTGIGKVDRAEVARMYASRIAPISIRLLTIIQPLVTPFETAKGIIYTRSSLLIEVKDAAGNVGYGEDVAFDDDWYTPETLDIDKRALQELLIPRVLSRSYLSPHEVAPDLNLVAASCEENCQMAIAALECALWDLYGHITGQSMQSLIGADAQRPAYAGVVLGIDTLEATLRSAHSYVEAGYKRFKVKIRPGDDIKRVRAIRQACPDVVLMLDANQSYDVGQINPLAALEPYNILCIEEPFDLSSCACAQERFALLSQLQTRLPLSICLDESMCSAADAYRALDYANLRMFALKIGRMGGIQPTLDFIHEAQQRDARVWMGGMYETSVSKRLHAMFCQIEGIDIPGDITATTHYFERDIALPPYTVENGAALLASQPGLGIILDAEVVAAVQVDTQVFKA